MDATLLPPAETEDAHKTDRKSVRRPRVELITRGERRRRWTVEQKQEIVAESLSPDTTPTEVARKRGEARDLFALRRRLMSLVVGRMTRPSVPGYRSSSNALAALRSVVANPSVNRS